MGDLESSLIRDASQPDDERPCNSLPEEAQVSSSYSTEGATVLQATFNLVNIYMGLGLLSMPYALRLAGWSGLLVLMAVTAIFCTSGKLLVQAFEALPPGIPQTYPNLGVQVLGPSGRLVVALFTVLEFFGGSCIMLVVEWKELVELLPAHDIFGTSPFRFAIAASLLCTLPILFIPNFRSLSWLNLMGCLATFAVTLTMLASVLLDVDRSRMPIQPPAGHDLLRWGIFQAIGIFALSVSGHSSLPVLRNSMGRPQDFDKVMNLGFGAMLVLYGIVAGCGYYYFGTAAHELVTADLASNSPFSRVSLLIPGLTVDKAVSACILINCLTTCPSLILVVQDMVWSVLPWASTRQKPEYVVGTAMRVTHLFLGAIVAYMAYSVLGDVMSLVGGFCSISCSLLVPSLFYLLLYRGELAGFQAVCVVALLMLGVCLLLLITGQNVLDIWRKKQETIGSNLHAGQHLQFWVA